MSQCVDLQTLDGACFDGEFVDFTADFVADFAADLSADFVADFAADLSGFFFGQFFIHPWILLGSAGDFS